MIDPVAARPRQPGREGRQARQSNEGVFPMIARILASLFAVCLAGAAEAQVPLIVWSAPASTCVPADATIKFNRHKVGVESVQHAIDNVDLITLNCPIGLFNAGSISSWQLGATYRDSTGAATTGFVRVRLYRVAAGGTVPTLMAEMNSNSFANTGVTTQRSPSFAHTFNFAANSYWVHVDLDRSSLSDIVILHNMQLVGDSCGICAPQARNASGPGGN